MGKRILIVDDNEDLRYMLRKYLGPSSDQLDETGDSLEAVQMALELRPDVIILDYEMPHMNGAEVARAIRQEMPDVPIFGFTAHPTRFDTFLQAGADRVFDKMNLPALVKAVNGEDIEGSPATDTTRPV